jgi:hypothetical protein
MSRAFAPPIPLEPLLQSLVFFRCSQLLRILIADDLFAGFRFDFFPGIACDCAALLCHFLTFIKGGWFLFF